MAFNFLQPIQLFIHRLSPLKVQFRW